MVVHIHSRRSVGTLLSALLIAGSALANDAVQKDGRWRLELGAAGSYASGNTDSRSFSLNADARRATAADRVALNARANYGSTDGNTTAELFGLAGRYEFNVTARSYGFGSAEALRDKPANIKSRVAGAAGLGYRILDTEATAFDLTVGLGYARDTFYAPAFIDDALRSSYGRVEALLGEESRHRLTESTTLKQKLVVYPNLGDRGEYRAVFDAGIAVAINRALSLTAGINYRYNSDPGVGIKKADTLLLTGITLKLD